MLLRFGGDRPETLPRIFLSRRCLGDGEVAVGAVRNHRLTRLKMQLGAIKVYRNYVRLERHQVGDAADFGIRLTIRP